MNYTYIFDILFTQIAIYLVMNRIFAYKPSKLIWFVPVVNAASIYALESLDYQSGIFFAFNVLLFFIVPWIVFGIKNIVNTLFVSFAVIGTFSLTEGCLNVMLSVINPDLSQLAFYISPVISAGIFAVFSLNRTLSGKIIDVLLTTAGTKITYNIFVWLMFALTSFFRALMYSIEKPAITYSMLVIILAMVAVSGVAFVLLIKNNIQKIHYKELSERLEKSVAEQIHYYENTNKANEDLRKFRHDFNNLKIGLQTYLRSNDVDGALKYIDSTNSLIEPKNLIYFTGNPIINALLNDKAELIKKDNISIDFEGMIPKSVLSPVELCVIFGNIIDNAIEACRKNTDELNKNIKIHVVTRGDYLFISVSNPTETPVKIIHNCIATDKQNKLLHGIGLYSVKSIAEKHDGHVSLSYDDYVFTAKVDCCLTVSA